MQRDSNPSADQLISSLSSEVDLSEEERKLIAETDIRTAPELLSLLFSFPSLKDYSGIDMLKLSTVAARQSGSFAATATAMARQTPKVLGFGAENPNSASASASAAPGSSMPGTHNRQLSGSIDLFDNRWPVRDQMARGTCVAFALAACRESHDLVISGNYALDLSEQFLYWATKQRDPNRSNEGTFLRFGAEALEHEGICEMNDWPYSGNLNLSNITHEAPGVDPSPTAFSNAGKWRYAARTRTASNVGSTGNAQTVLSLLHQFQRPVAITLPVFYDPVTGQGNNWQTPTAFSYGIVSNNPPGALPLKGHAVCVIGFVQDWTEPTGGYFIFRNSWGSDWATHAPSTYSYSPAVGYGQVPATYVDRQVWEICQL